jgi:Zn ribbon nucleic-acid-binding protein
MTRAKRFISGAVCPSCQEVDRTVIEAVTDAPESASLNEMATEMIRRRCVSCGFTEALDPEQAAVTAPLPRARYEKSRQTTTKVETVKIIDLGRPKSS